MKTRNELLNQIKTELSNDYYLNQRDEYIVNDCVDKLLKAINYNQCCTQLKDTEKLTFDEWTKEKGFEIQSDNFYKNMHGSMIKTDDIKELYRVYTTF